MESDYKVDDLSIEIKFAIASFNAQVDQMSHTQAMDMCKTLFQTLQTQKAGYTELLKHKWNGPDKLGGLG